MLKKGPPNTAEAVVGFRITHKGSGDTKAMTDGESPGSQPSETSRGHDGWAHRFRSISPFCWTIDVATGSDTPHRG